MRDYRTRHKSKQPVTRRTAQHDIASILDGSDSEPMDLGCVKATCGYACARTTHVHEIVVGIPKSTTASGICKLTHYQTYAIYGRRLYQAPIGGRQGCRCEEKGALLPRRVKYVNMMSSQSIASYLIAISTVRLTGDWCSSLRTTSSMQGSTGRSGGYWHRRPIPL